jgi:hypothetical protein
MLLLLFAIQSEHDYLPLKSIQPPGEDPECADRKMNNKNKLQFRMAFAAVGV